MLRKPLAVLVASAMVLSSGAFAASDSSSQPRPAKTTKNEAPLPPAGAAGIEKAQADDDTTLYIIGGVILVGGILALVLANNGHSTSSTH